jgi:hypothetical protein
MSKMLPKSKALPTKKALPTSLVTLRPSISNPIVKGRRYTAALAPLAGQTGMTTAPYQSGWIPVPFGSLLNVKLTIANFVGGTLTVAIDTLQEALTDPVMGLGNFEQIPGNGVAAFLALRPTGSYIRVTATPGNGDEAPQGMDWVINGQLYVPYAPQT